MFFDRYFSEQFLKTNRFTIFFSNVCPMYRKQVRYEAAFVSHGKQSSKMLVYILVVGRNELVPLSNKKYWKSSLFLWLSNVYDFFQIVILATMSWSYFRFV